MHRFPKAALRWLCCPPGSDRAAVCLAGRALTAAGLRPELLHEHNRGHFRLHAGQRIPQVSSLRAAKAG